MATTLGHRIFLAHKAIETLLGRNVPNPELGRLIAAAEEPPRVDAKGKPKPYSAGNVLRWKKAGSGAADAKTPSLETIKALGKLSGMCAGFIAFEEGGQFSDAPPAVLEVVGAKKGSGVKALPFESYQPVTRRRRPVATPAPASRPGTHKPKGR